MVNDTLTKLLPALGQRPVLSTPANFQDLVWREIRRRKETTLSWVEELAALLWAPRIAWTSLALAVAMGGSAALFLEAGAKSQPYAQPLNLEVFSVSPPSLPSTLLDRDS